jgi:hypothetical protein
MARKANRHLHLILPTQNPVLAAHYRNCEYQNPAIRVDYDSRGAKIPTEHHLVRARSKYAGKGRHENLPKIQGVDVTAPADIDARPQQPRTDAGLGLLMKRLVRNSNV